MADQKAEYIVNQLRRTFNKKYENYVITRIWHILNRLDVKFVTQQYVTRPKGCALTDMYFPQICLHLEVNESQHYTPDQAIVDRDVVREADIINATNHKLEIINATLSIEEINKRVDEIVELIKQLLEKENPAPWDYEAEYNPETYIKKGKISINDGVAFRTIADACNCFGHRYKGMQRAFTKHHYEDRMLWFPKLYKNADWDNYISYDETEIHESRIKDPDGYLDGYLNEAPSSVGNKKERIVFARVRSNLGDIMYRFKGVFKFDESDTKKAQGKVVYKRTATSVKTYPPA